MIDYKAEYEAYLKGDVSSYTTIEELIGAVALILRDKEQLELDTYVAHAYNGLKEYIENGSVADVTSSSLDILWLCTYITQDMKYAIMVKDIGHKSTNGIIVLAGRWSYQSHYDHPEVYGITQLPSWD